MAIAYKLPIGYYVYTITVDGVVRYIGKGKGLRLYCHMKEVRSRLNRDYRLQNIGSRLQQNLTKAVLSGAKVIERVLVYSRNRTKGVPTLAGRKARSTTRFLKTS
jgi:hypothetical protein